MGLAYRNLYNKPESELQEIAAQSGAFLDSLEAGRG